MKTQDKSLLEAKSYEDMRDKIALSQIENFKFLKAQVADWYIAITAACFAIGGISISLAGDDIKHPALFWWGSVLLIANGVFTFFVRKAELDSEFLGLANLKQSEADLWTMSKIAREHSAGNRTRVDVFKSVSERFTNDYKNDTKPPSRRDWISFAVQTSMPNIVFGLLLFPVLLLASQLPNYMQITLEQYALILLTSCGLYIIYMVVGAYKAVQHRQKEIAADLQIKSEVMRKQ